MNTALMLAGLLFIPAAKTQMFALSLGVENYGVMTSYTMVCMVLGYSLGILTIPRFISQPAALTISAVLGLVLTLLIVFGDNTLIRLPIASWCLLARIRI